MSRSIGLAGGLFFILLMIFPGPAAAFDPWMPRDTVLQSAFLTLMWIDYKQTLDISTGKYPDVTESNLVLGKQATRREVTRYFALTALAHTALVAVLPKDWRLALQSGAIGMELASINNNRQVGISIRF